MAFILGFSYCVFILETYSPRALLHTFFFFFLHHVNFYLLIFIFTQQIYEEINFTLTGGEIYSKAFIFSLSTRPQAFVLFFSTSVIFLYLIKFTCTYIQNLPYIFFFSEFPFIPLFSVMWKNSILIHAFYVYLIFFSVILLKNQTSKDANSIPTILSHKKKTSEMRLKLYSYLLLRYSCIVVNETSKIRNGECRMF